MCGDYLRCESYQHSESMDYFQADANLIRSHSAYLFMRSSFERNMCIFFLYCICLTVSVFLFFITNFPQPPNSLPYHPRHALHAKCFLHSRKYKVVPHKDFLTFTGAVLPGGGE